MKGYVYAIRIVGTSRVKIGYSTNPALRLAALQTGCPDELELVATARAPQDAEGMFQGAVVDHKIRGEWYDIPLEDDLWREIFAALELLHDVKSHADKMFVVRLFEEQLRLRGFALDDVEVAAA